MTVQDIQSTVAQYLGPDRARHSFEAFAVAHHIALDPAAPADFELLQHAEHLIASSIGAASSRLVMSLLLRKRTVSAKAALKLLDDSHAALHFNREILQTALNHVRQGIAVFDAELQLICSNRQFGEILGLPPHLVQIGIPLREILEFMGAISPPGVRRQRRAAGTGGSPPTPPKASPIWSGCPDRHMVIEVRTNRMPGGGLVITFSDVTPSFEAAEALERANATLEKRVRDRTEELTRLNSELALAKSTAEDANISKTRFLAAASHDILQPLNAARLYVTSLVERQSGGEDSRLVENIDDSLEAIEEILGALLDISRLDAGAMTPSITSFKMGDLMRSLEIEFAPIARAKGLKLTFVPCSLPVESDRAAAAAAAAEPDLQRHQIHPARPRAGRLPPPRPERCRSASTTPASAFPCSSAARSSRNFTGSNRARGSRAASASGCRSSSAWRACSTTASRSIPMPAAARSSR